MALSDQSTYEKKIWIDSYEKGIMDKLDYQDTLVPQYLENSVKNFPDNPALIFQGFTLNFREFNEMVGRFKVE